MNADPPRDPRPNDIWLTGDGELKVFDGEDWVAYEDVPADAVNPNVVLKVDGPDQPGGRSAR